MSLDVYLKNPEPVIVKGTGIYIRENGATRQLTIEEIKERYPDSDIVEREYEEQEVFSANVTHNLGKMAGMAGIYEHLWRPEELGITVASQLIVPLAQGLDTLRSKPEYYKGFNPSNGWGDYEGLVQFVENYLKACIDNPNATVSVSR